MNSDGVSYLELGEAFLRGDWSVAINSYWSPLYPLWLGAGLRLLRPSPFWEGAAVRLLHLPLYMIGLFCLERLLEELRRYQPARQRGDSAGPPKEGLWLWGYGVFISAAVSDIGLGLVTPDLGVLAGVFALGWLSLRLARLQSSSAAAALGGAAGVGYLVKAILFPVGLVFIGCAALGGLRPRARPLRTLLVAMGAFLPIAGLMIGALYWRTGRWTFGDSARINHAVFVCGIKGYPRWEGGLASWPERCGRPDHAPRVLREDPLVLAFGERPGSYPLWSEPAFWYGAARFDLDFQRQMRRLRISIRTFRRQLLREKTAFLVALILLACFANPRRIAVRWAGLWPLWFPAVSGLTFYALVRTENRYHAPFWTMALLCAYAAAASSRHRRYLAQTAGASAFVVAVLLGLRSIGWAPLSAAAQEHAHHEAAMGLAALGARPGDPVAWIGYRMSPYWARLAGVRVVADLGRSARFWALAPAQRREIEHLFASAGARFVVAEKAPADASSHGWVQLGHSRYHGRSLGAAR